jgi:hypothetical protein
MPDSNTPERPSDENGQLVAQRWPKLDDAAHALALVLTVTYGAGFLIVSLHHSEFGFAEFDLLRPKIFCAGAWFFVLTAVPALTAARIFNLFGLERGTGFVLSAGPTHRVTAELTVGAGFYAGCYAIALFFGNLIFGPDRPQLKHTYYFNFSIALTVVEVIIVGKIFRKQPEMCLFFASLVNVNQGIAAYLRNDRSTFWLSVWFYGVGIGFLIICRAVNDPAQRKKLEWEFYVPAYLVLLLFFSVTIYGQINPALGGGKPVPVTLFLDENSTASTSKIVNGKLVEETDHGYYILQDDPKRAAHFYRREFVKEIEFPSWTLPAPQKTPADSVKPDSQNPQK